MLKQFEQGIRKEINRAMAAVFPGYVLDHDLSEDSSVVFYFREEKVNKYIAFSFVSERDYVIPSLQWSKIGGRPKETVFSLDELVRARDDIDWFCGRESGWIGLCEFGLINGFFEIDSCGPDEERLKEIFSDNERKDFLISFGFDCWEDALPFHTWDMIDEFFPGVIESDDVDRAISQVVDQLKHCINNLFFPFLEKIR